jgi:hypothetical protein
MLSNSFVDSQALVSLLQKENPEIPVTLLVLPFWNSPGYAHLFWGSACFQSICFKSQFNQLLGQASG